MDDIVKYLLAPLSEEEKTGFIAALVHKLCSKHRMNNGEITNLLYQALAGCSLARKSTTVKDATAICGSLCTTVLVANLKDAPQEVQTEYVQMFTCAVDSAMKQLLTA